MAQELIIEHHGQLRRFQQFPVRIGQGLDNDLIITGAGIGEYHAEITAGENGWQICAAQPVVVNGVEITTTGTAQDNDQLQIGLEILHLNPVLSPVTTGKKGGWWAIFSHPLAVCGWFLLAIALPTWEGYLNSPQTYIPNYEIPLIVTFWILALSFVLHSMVFSVARRYLILPVVGIISAFIAGGTLADWVADWYGFRFNGRFGEIAAVLVVFFSFALIWRAFLRKFLSLHGKMLRKVLFTTLIPVILFSTYSYLKQNDFFKKRAGSYPSYQITLQNGFPDPNKIKSIEEFFMIDKSEYKD